MHFRTFSILFFLFFLSSCITEANQQPQANQILQKLNQSIQKHQWEQAIVLFDPKFFKRIPKKYWIHQMKLAIQEKGEIKSFNMVSHQKDPRFGADFYIYVMSVIHEHGVSHETITIIKPIDDKPMVISGFLFK